MQKLILFDLDGTLTDSGPGVKAGVAYALKKMGYEEHATRDLDCFMGPPLVPALMEFTGCSEEQANEGVAWFHEDYDDKGIYNNSVYPGIPKLLCDLKQADCILGIASSKPENMVVQVLEHFDLLQYFDYLAGAQSDGVGGSEKAEVVERAIREAGYYMNRGNVTLVGDRKYDVYGAGKCGIACVGAAFGYGGREELSESGADYVVDTVQELNQLLLRIAADELPLRGEERRPARGMSAGAKVWDILFPIVYMLAGSFLTGLIAAGILLLTVPSVSEMWTHANSYSLAAMGVFDVFTIFFLGRFYRRDNRRFHSVNSIRWIWPHTVLSTVMVVAIGHVLGMIIDITQMDQLFPFYSKSVAGVFASIPMPLLIVYVGLLAPVAEELIFRGLLFRRLRAHLGIGWAVGISSAVFGIFHGNMIQFLYGTALGIFLALIYEKSGRILVPVLAHMFCNLFSIFSDGILWKLFGRSAQDIAPYVMIVEAAVAALCVCILFLPRKMAKP